MTKPDARPDLDDRYGRRSHRSALVVSGVIGVVALGWLGWVISDQVSPEVTSAMTDYKIIDDHQVTATLEVRLDSTDVKATCVVRAYSQDHSNVGETAVAVPTGQGEHVQVPVTIRTERRATSVESQGCTAPGQKHPR